MSGTRVPPAGNNLDLFADAGHVSLPPGFRYRPDFIDPETESGLADQIAGLQLAPYEFRGVAARRRVVSFGVRHGYQVPGSAPISGIPSFLEGVQRRAALLAGVQPNDFQQVLLSEYTPGTPIGWHTDRGHFGLVVGISLLSAATLRFRRRSERGWSRRAQSLEARSAYLLSGAARDVWQHSIPAVAALRYSITFRTLRDSGATR